MANEEPGWRRATEDALAKPMFILTVFYLILVAALTRIAPALMQGQELPGSWWVIGTLIALWPIFLVEGLIRFFLRARSEWGVRYLAYCLATGLLPPLRLATKSSTRPNHIWLPRLGWHEVNFDLDKTLERAFGMPMLFMALLILPILAVHYFAAAQVKAFPSLLFALDVGTALIWLGFTIEFVIRISAAERQWAYAFTHWLDLAIVILPMLEFMPFLRVLRLTQTARLKSLLPVINYYVSYYRIYGVAGKGWRALILLRVVHSLFSRSPVAELDRLASQLSAKEEEAREIQREIDYYRRQIETLKTEHPEIESQDSPETEAGPEPTNTHAQAATESRM